MWMRTSFIIAVQQQFDCRKISDNWFILFFVFLSLFFCARHYINVFQDFVILFQSQEVQIQCNRSIPFDSMWSFRIKIRKKDWHQQEIRRLCFTIARDITFELFFFRTRNSILRLVFPHWKCKRNEEKIKRKSGNNMKQ